MEDHSHHQHHQHHMDHTNIQKTTPVPVYHVVQDHGSHDHSNHGDTSQQAGIHSDHHDHHQMYFNTAYNVTVIFQQLVMDSKSTVFLVCLCTFILAVGYQGTKWLRQYLHANYRGRIHSIKSREHLMQTVLYGMEFFVSYLLMLIVMTYNAWVFAVTILGIGFGYFLIGWHRKYGGSCPVDCPNVTDYSKDVLPQELVPLDDGNAEGDTGCEGCGEMYGENASKETDGLT